MFSGPSNFVESVDTAFWVVMVISVFFLVVVTVLMITFVIKYSRKKHPKAVNYHGSVPLEVTWTVVPTLLVLIMFYYGWVGYKQMSDVPEDAMVIDAYAQMWKWEFDYGNGVKDDTLYVPINKAVKLNLHSRDVMHAFFVPAFRVKKDVTPNRNNVAWFEATQLGSYDIACAEYCGLNHSMMYTKVVVLPQENFNFWKGNMELLAGQGGEQGTAQTETQSQAETGGTEADTTGTGQTGTDTTNTNSGN